MSMVLLLQFQVFHNCLHVTNTFEKSENPDTCQIFLCHDYLYVQLEDLHMFPNIPLKPYQLDYNLLKISQLIFKDREKEKQEGKFERVKGGQQKGEDNKE